MFTELFIESLIIKNEKYDIREKSGRGFCITVYPSGAKSYTFFYHFNGRKRRMTLGKCEYLSLKKAKSLHKEALIILESGIDPALRKQLRIRDTNKSLNIRKLKCKNY